MKKPKIPQTVKEIDNRITEIKGSIEDENKTIATMKSEFSKRQTEFGEDVRNHEILIEEYTLLLKHYQEERVLVSNPSSRDGRHKN